MIRYSQQDPKWKNKLLGTSGLTIGNYGCFLTCFAMLLEVEPDKVNERVKIFGGFAGALLSAAVVPNAYKQISVTQTWCTNNPAPLDVIDNALKGNYPVIVQVDTSPVTGIQSHFVILTGKVGHDYNMVDPWPLVDEPPATLLGRYGHGRDTATIITYIAVIGGIENLKTPPIAPQGKSRTIARCHLRTYPVVNKDSNILVLPIGKEFELTGDTVTSDGYTWRVVKCYIEESSLK